MKAKMTRKEYAKSKWARCPVCGDSDISGDSVEIDGNYATQDVNCIACGAYWTDWYKLEGFDHIYDDNGQLVEYEDG